MDRPLPRSTTRLAHDQMPALPNRRQTAGTRANLFNLSKSLLTNLLCFLMGHLFFPTQLE